MDFSLPPSLTTYLSRLDTFIATQITPLQHTDNNNRFFDHRREPSRTDWTTGLPQPEWEALLASATLLADKAGFWRFSLPTQYGGSNTSSGRGANLWMAVIREHLASRGLGLANDLQNEHSVVGNFPDVIMVLHFGTEGQKRELIEGRLRGEVRITFGLTEPGHGSDATFMETRGWREERGGRKGWRVTGRKMWQTNMHRATHCFVFARTGGRDGEARGVTCFVIPRETEGIVVEGYEWTLNMPTDHATVRFEDVWVPEEAVLGGVGEGFAVAQAFVHENRIRQAASSLGAAVYCVEESCKYARKRKPFGKALGDNQAIQFPLVELATQCEMLRLLIRKTAWEMDQMDHVEVEKKLSDKVSMCNYWANRLCCEAADRAIQVHGGWGYSRHLPFEHIWRHHRRYRITEGSEEIQMRKIGAYLLGYIGPKKESMAKL
ncbi:Acyl-CoA dehydrogenase-like protein 8 [Elsinoe fawcettii]|nr:Acyl-CoA dehydrogenase-like protein 8 [Elsinoe fawcettii]